MEKITGATATGGRFTQEDRYEKPSWHEEEVIGLVRWKFFEEGVFSWYYRGMKTEHIGKSGGFVHWAPRIASIVFVLFLSLFSLDVIEPGRSIGEIVVGLLMHNIPVFVLGTLTAVAWKHGIVGGIAFISAGILYIALVFLQGVRGGLDWRIALAWSIQLSGVAFVIGGLYIADWRRERRRDRE